MKIEVKQCNGCKYLHYDINDRALCNRFFILPIDHCHGTQYQSIV